MKKLTNEEKEMLKGVIEYYISELESMLSTPELRKEAEEDIKTCKKLKKKLGLRRRYAPKESLKKIFG